MNTIFKRTKILATLGPSTSTPQKIQQLVESGTNGFRLNFSHGTYEERLDQIKWIREASSKLNKSVAVLQDLQGPKIRLGTIDDNYYEVKTGDELILDYAVKNQNGNILPVQYNLAEKVKVKDAVYIFDGKVKTVVTRIVSATAIALKVENDGILMSRKGLNLPDTDFAGDILTDKDLADIEFGATQDYDYVALSFVQSEEDINNLRQILAGFGSKAHIIAKVETKAAIKPSTLEAIVKASDGVMVARGDLAVEAGAEVVPIVQRQIIDLCRKNGKLSIVATQMLASMVDSPEPTRAEVSDVANATIQGTDTVMLSDETANGKYPIESVSAMRKTIIYTQEHSQVFTAEHAKVADDERNRDAISQAAVTIAESVGADAIIAETKSGATASNISKMRPSLPIFAVTSDNTSAQQLALAYATRSYIRPDGEKAGLSLAKELATNGIFGVKKDYKVVIVSGKQPGLVGGTDTVRVRTISV